MIRRIAFALGLMVVLHLLPAMLLAQQLGTADLGGRVVDAQGAAVGGATVVAVQKATALTREATTHADGRFSLSGLAPGQYEIRASATGFAETVFPTVSLAVGRSVSLAAHNTSATSL